MKIFALNLFLAASIHTGFAAEFRDVVPGTIQNPVQAFVPFLLWTTDVASFRYQQVYNASGFFGLGKSPFLINEIYLFTSGGNPTPNAVLPNIQIDLSTTSKAADGLNSAFADNIGANNTLVYSGALNFFLSPSALYSIKLQHPFLFDPTAGNLLMDVKNFQTIPPPPGGVRMFNSAEATLGDSVSSLVAADANALTGGRDTGGLLTGFVGTLVPEPSIWALLVTCTVAGALVMRRHRVGFIVTEKRR